MFKSHIFRIIITTIIT